MTSFYEAEHITMIEEKPVSIYRVFLKCPHCKKIHHVDLSWVALEAWEGPGDRIDTLGIRDQVRLDTGVCLDCQTMKEKKDARHE